MNKFNNKSYTYFVIAYTESENIKQETVPIIRLYGVTDQGNSVCCHVHGFSSYLCYKIPSNFSESDCASFKVSSCKIVDKPILLLTLS